MPLTSRVMMGYGLLLLAIAALGGLMLDAGFGATLAPSAAMLAAGAAAAQGRRSLRRGGHFIGSLLPVLCAALFGWRAMDAWVGSAQSQQGRMLEASLLTVIAVGGLVTALLLMKLRAGDTIAERGYSVLPAFPRARTPDGAAEPTPPEVNQR